VKRPTELLVLAGGFGVRLRATIPDVPKPLAPVNGRPFLSYLVQNWIAQGIRSFTFLLHHQAPLIEAFLQEEQSAGPFKECRVRVVREPRPLNTGGAIAHAVRTQGISESFLVGNADTWLESGIQAIAGATPPAVGVVIVPDCNRYGAVQIEGDEVLAFTEKQNSMGTGLINAGLYHLHSELFADWNTEPFSLESNLFPRLAAARQLRAVPVQSEFLDIGIPQDYFRFCRWIETNKVAAP
jgi:D-glycero-alpha-D-manno-heptose 1-phosphate guanylyltransferase